MVSLWLYVELIIHIQSNSALLSYSSFAMQHYASPFGYHERQDIQMGSRSAAHACCNLQVSTFIRGNVYMRTTALINQGTLAVCSDSHYIFVAFMLLEDKY